MAKAARISDTIDETIKVIPKTMKAYEELINLLYRIMAKAVEENNVSFLVEVLQMRDEE